jgi:hypothetical protein
MAISNTSVLIKRSLVTPTPAALQSGELAYSYASNNIFIGTGDGQSAIAIGGYNTYQAVNTATSSNTANMLVKRDSNGAFSGRVYGLANSAIQLDSGRDFSVSGGDISASAISFNGTSNVTLNASLNNVPGLTANTVGSATSVPVITYGANGRILNVTTAAISSDITLSDGANTDTIQTGDTILFTGVGGLTSLIKANTNEVVFGTDDTVLRSNTTLGSAGHLQTLKTDLRISGNLYIDGTQTSVDTKTLTISDPLIYLASNNDISNTVDIGFIGNYNDGKYSHTGLVRHAADGKYYLFDNYTPEAANTNSVNVQDASFNRASLVANLTGGTVSGLSAAILVADGGTGANTFSTGRIVVGNGTGALSSLANVSLTTTGTAGTNKTITSVATDNYGRFTEVAYQDISGLTVVQGGTGANTFTTGKIVVGNGTGALSSLDNVAFELTGTLQTSNTLTSLTVDTYGRVTAARTNAIAIDASQVTSGILPFARGGTNQTSYTTGGMVISDGTRLTSLANSTFNVTGTAATNATLTSLSVDTYGRTTGAVYQSISGLTPSQGGTGLSTITQYGITYGNGINNLGVTAAAGTDDIAGSNQFLTVNSAGVPVWSTTFDGGVF